MDPQVGILALIVDASLDSLGALEDVSGTAHVTGIWQPLTLL